jgi:ribonuclease III
MRYSLPLPFEYRIFGLTMRDRIAAIVGLAPNAPHLDEALTHPSYANEQRSVRHNQRLEFLGDAVLGFCVSELLCARFPEADEGALTRMRARLVNADALAGWGRRIGLRDVLLLGRGAGAAGLHDGTNVLADGVEALIAAAYLDGGLEQARALCLKVVEAELLALERTGARDPKSELQERLQAMGGLAPTYELIDSGGPPHERWFRVSVRQGPKMLAQGSGRSKRAAERAAAEQALLLAELRVSPTNSDASREEP